MASVRSCQELLLCLTQSVPVGSWTLHWPSLSPSVMVAVPLGQQSYKVEKMLHSSSWEQEWESVRETALQTHPGQ